MRYELIDRERAPAGPPPVPEPPVEPPAPQAAFGPGVPFRPLWPPRDLLKRWRGQRLSLVRPRLRRSVPPATADHRAIVSALAPGKVARITPTGAETVEGIKLGLADAARRLGTSVRTWDADGTVYAEVTGDGESEAPR